jgi:hypothetical protein
MENSAKYYSCVLRTRERERIIRVWKLFLWCEENVALYTFFHVSDLFTVVDSSLTFAQILFLSV